MLAEDVSGDTNHGSILGKGPANGSGLPMSIVSHLELRATAVWWRVVLVEDGCVLVRAGVCWRLDGGGADAGCHQS